MLKQVPDNGLGFLNDLTVITFKDPRDPIF